MVFKNEILCLWANSWPTYASGAHWLMHFNLHYCILGSYGWADGGKVFIVMQNPHPKCARNRVGAVERNVPNLKLLSNAYCYKTWNGTTPTAKKQEGQRRFEVYTQGHNYLKYLKNIKPKSKWLNTFFLLRTSNILLRLNVQNVRFVLNSKGFELHVVTGTNFEGELNMIACKLCFTIIIKVLF